MSVKKAQKLVDEIYEELDISIVRYPLEDLQFLRDTLDELLAIGVETEELADPSEVSDDSDFGLDDIGPYDEEEEEL